MYVMSGIHMKKSGALISFCGTQKRFLKKEKKVKDFIKFNNDTSKLYISVSQLTQSFDETKFFTYLMQLVICWWSKLTSLKVQHKIFLFLKVISILT